MFGDHLLSQDGSLLFVCNVDAVVAYATSTGEQVARLQHAARVTAICLHPRDSLLLFTASIDGRITLWDLSTGAPAHLWDVGSPIESLAVSPAGDTGAVAVAVHAGPCSLRCCRSQPQAPSAVLSLRCVVFDHARPQCIATIAAYVSTHWRLRQAGRLFAYDLGSSAAKSAGGRAKVSQARRLVVRPAACVLHLPAGI